MECTHNHIVLGLLIKHEPMHLKDVYILQPYTKPARFTGFIIIFIYLFIYLFVYLFIYFFTPWHVKSLNMTVIGLLKTITCI